MKRVIKLIKKCILKDNTHYRILLGNFKCYLATGIFLVFASSFCTGLIGILYKILGCWNLFKLVSFTMQLVVIRKSVQKDAEILALQYTNEYENYDDLISDLENYLKSNKNASLNNKREYTKDGKLIIDAQFEDIEESKKLDDLVEDSTDSAPEQDFSYIQIDTTLEEDITNLVNYVKDVAYKGYEDDLLFLGAFYDVVASKIENPAFSEKVLQDITNEILAKACEHYDLPMVRKRTNPKN